MGAPAKSNASYADVLSAPAHKVAEVVAGDLHVSPRPAGPHAAAASALGEELGPPFKRGRGGPGGWIILDEPELHLGPDILVPDLAGWRRETMDEISGAAYFTTRPDWVCEVLSPTTDRFDRSEKIPAYARAGVSHAWLVNPLLRTLEVLRLVAAAPDQPVILSVFHDDARVRAEPFAAVELELGISWQDVRL